jgi:hypothetical protein
MADDIGEERRLDPQAAAAPNRDRHGEPPIIEGEVAERDEAPSTAAKEAPPEAANNPDAAPPPEPAPHRLEPGSAGPRRSTLFIAGGVGGVIGAVVAAGIVLVERSTFEADLSRRLAAVEAPLSDLNRRVGVLENAAQSAKAAADAAKASQGDIQAARTDATKALALATKTAASVEQQKQLAAEKTPPAGDSGDVEARLQKLESDRSAVDKTAADLAPIEDRLAKLEAALVAPKSETRVAPEHGDVGRDAWVAMAVAAEAVSDGLVSGAPYAAEQAALERLGADPAKVAALKPFADKGAPAAAALALGFDKIAPDVVKAATPKDGGGVMDRLISNMSKVVRITPVGEAAGDNPAALVSQIESALGRGEIQAAMALWARLPEPARRASADWAGGAEARLAADAAAAGLLNDAMVKLASGDKP